MLYNLTCCGFERLYKPLQLHPQTYNRPVMYLFEEKITDIH
jgi:hypothetical protein